MASKTIHKGKYFISIKRGYEDCKRNITITVDKVFESDNLKISLSNDDDPTFLCVLNLTRCDYEDLKKQQGLLIDFDNFPSQLVRLLQQCATNNMFLILQQTNPTQFYFEIVEHNDFKRLVHLSLKTGPATDTDIKQHMADTIYTLKKNLSSFQTSATSNEAVLIEKCSNLERKTIDLKQTITKLETEKIKLDTEFHETIKHERERLNQERLQFQKNFETSTKHQIANSQEYLNMKDKKIDELNSVCKQLRENVTHLENQLSDKSHRINLIETEIQKSHIEVATLKAKNATLEREISEKERHCYQLNSKCGALEKTVNENSDVIKDLNKSLELTKKEKTSLEERLALLESLANKHNDAAYSSSEQLLKANQIISKQNTDLIEMKEKLLCRTAIALEQEKVIEVNTREIEKLKLDINNANQNCDKIEMELENLRKKYDTNEKALQDRDETIKNNNMVIQWLHKKVEETCPSNELLTMKSQNRIQTATSSTPYFIPRNIHNNSSQMVSDESINFYGTSNSKLSNIEDSPQMIWKEKSNKLGLDPKYLQPASNDNISSKVVKPKDVFKTKPSEVAKQKGKENKIELPKVDYREKKSSKPSTFRATPVSAYFP